MSKEKFIRTSVNLARILAITWFLSSCGAAINAVGVDCKKAIPDGTDLNPEQLDPDTCTLPLNHVKVNAGQFPLPPTYDALISIDPDSDPSLSLLASSAAQALDMWDGKDDDIASNVVVKAVHIRVTSSLSPIAKTSIIGGNGGIATLEIRRDDRFKGKGLSDTTDHERQHMTGDQNIRTLEVPIIDGGGELKYVGDGLKIAGQSDLTDTISNDGLKPSEGAAVFDQISEGGELSAAEMETKLFGEIPIMSKDYKNSALVFWIISRAAKLSAPEMTQLIRTNNWVELFKAITDSNKPLSQLDPSYQRRALELLIKIPKDMKSLPSVQAKKEMILQTINKLRFDISK